MIYIIIVFLAVYLFYQVLFGERDEYERKKKEQEIIDRTIKLHEERLKKELEQWRNK